MPTASSGPSLPVEVAVEDDRARWVSLGIVLIAAFIVVLDTTILNVAIPTIIRDLDTTLAAVEWVVTGYALVFATFLIIGGRLGDVYGHRRIFMIGVALFGIGSFVASISTSVGQLIVGEAVIEGMGASMMLPATIAIMSGTFRGKERATAFAAWGAVAGVGAACGPLIGGFLTTNYSWRWSFRINVIVAPIALIGAWLFVKKGLRAEHKPRIDVPGAAMVAVGMFSLVFALSEGGTYGWTVPIKDFSIAGTVIWPESMPVSFIPLLFLFAVAVLGVFVVVERRKERLARDPLLEFSQFKLEDLPLRPDHRIDPGDGTARAELRAADLPPGRQAPHRGAERLVAAADGRLGDHRRPGRSSSHQPVRHDRRGPDRASCPTPSASSSSTTSSPWTSPGGSCSRG